MCFSLTGCFSTPVQQPFINGESTLNYSYPAVVPEDAVNIALKNLLPPHLERLVKENCIEGENYVYPTKAENRPKYCYKVSSGGEYISRINKSVCTVGKLDKSSSNWQNINVRATGDRCHTPRAGFVGILDLITHEKLVNELNKIGEQYVSYYKSVSEHLSKLDSQLKDYELQIIDNTGILTQGEKAKFFERSSFETERLWSVENALKNKPYKNSYRAYFNLAPNLNERFVIDGLKDQITISEDVDEVVKIEIDSIYFDFIPSSFNLQNEELEFYVETSRRKYDDRVLLKSTFKNKTNSYITVNSVTGFFNKLMNSSLFDSYDNGSIKIPPMSAVSLNGDFGEVRKLYKDSKMRVYDRAVKVEYGFSLQYTIPSKSKTIDLIEKNSITIDKLLMTDVVN